VNAAILVARTLVQSHFQKGSPELREAKERARYCQLLSSRAKLSPIDAHHVDLAAWISALDHEEGLSRRLAEEYGLESLVFPTEGDESNLMEKNILSLVKCYQTEERKDPSIGMDHALARKRLYEVWVDSADKKSLARRFSNLLHDEEFLGSFKEDRGTILIVDPEEAVAPVLSPPLTAEGYEVKVVDSADIAENFMAVSCPHLVIAEINMPLVSGLALCEQIKRDQVLCAVPVILITSRRGSSSVRKGLRAGADDVMHKPVDLEMLSLKVKHIMESIVRREPESGVSGSLEDMSFTDMIQIVCAGGKSMEIQLTHEGEKGEVFVRNGDVIHAAVDDETGEEAFYELMGWSTGGFSANRCDEFLEETIQSSLMSLLMEGSRRADEAADT